MKKEEIIKKMNPAKDKPATITSPQEYGIENEKRIHKKYGVFSKLYLEMQFDILLFTAWIILLLFLRKC
jgi:hypothetical protein